MPCEFKLNVRRQAWLEQNEQAGGMSGDEDREIRGERAHCLINGVLLTFQSLVCSVSEHFQDLKASHDLSKYRGREREVRGRKRYLF